MKQIPANPPLLIKLDINGQGAQDYNIDLIQIYPRPQSDRWDILLNVNGEMKCLNDQVDNYFCKGVKQIVGILDDDKIIYTLTLDLKDRVQINLAEIYDHSF